MRLDSGDLAKLSIEVRRRLDKEGFTNTKIIASNSLDEYIISSIKKEGCAIDIWGVGTKLVTGDTTPAASCVYKLAAVKEAQDWQPRMKISDHSSKISLPGIQNVRRFYDRKKNLYCHDMITNQLTTEIDQNQMFSLTLNRMINISNELESFDLLIPIIDNGTVVYQTPKLQDIQQYASNELTRLSYSFKRFINPDYYSVGLEKNFYHYKNQLLQTLTNKARI